MPAAEFVAERTRPLRRAARSARRSPSTTSSAPAATRGTAPGSRRLWRACVASGDLYRARLRGPLLRRLRGVLRRRASSSTAAARSTVAAPERVAEENWFFRLSRYRDGRRRRDRVGPAPDRAGGAPQRGARVRPRRPRRLQRVARRATRAGGWGIPVPGDPAQVIYVWFDALGNYVTALGYGGDDGDVLERWWRDARRAGPRDRQGHPAVPRRVLAGVAAVVRGLAAADRIFVHDYLTVDGPKIGKSRGNGADPTALADALHDRRAALVALREVPRVGDTDFRESALAGPRPSSPTGSATSSRPDRGLAAARPVRPGRPPDPSTAAASCCRGWRSPRRRLMSPSTATTSAVRPMPSGASSSAPTGRCPSCGRGSSRGRLPAGDADAGRRLDAILGDLLEVAGILGEEVEPFLPAAATRIAGTLRTLDPASARALFRKPGQPPP